MCTRFRVAVSHSSVGAVVAHPPSGKQQCSALGSAAGRCALCSGRLRAQQRHAHCIGRRHSCSGGNSEALAWLCRPL